MIIRKNKNIQLDSYQAINRDSFFSDFLEEGFDNDNKSLPSTCFNDIEFSANMLIDKNEELPLVDYYGVDFLNKFDF